MINTLGRREIKFSLDSSDLLYSNTLANVYNYSIEKFFKQVRMFGLLKPELKELVCRYFWDNVPRLGSIGLSINNQNQKEGNLERFLVNFQDIINVKIDREHCPFIVGGDKGEGVTEYLERNGIVVNNKDYQHRMLYKYCSDVNKDLAQLFLNYSNGNYDNTQFEKKYGTPHEIVLDKNNETEINHSRFEQQKPYMLSEAIKAYINESKASGITDKSINEYSSALELFIRVQGDSDVTAITREHLVKTKTILAKLPPNLNKKTAYKNKSIEQIIRLKHKPVSQTTLNNYMIRISQLFTWMEKYGKIQTNIAKDLTTKIKTSNRDFREVFSDDMITAFFTSSEYLTTDKPENHWIPLIALFSGMRQNEICQLYVDDIKNKEGVYYFDINSKQDKNESVISYQQFLRLFPDTDHGVFRQKILQTGLVEKGKIRLSNVRKWSEKRLRER